ncbi:hypothetical protein CFD26_101949 [Aspergillus turcosus]|uniref:Uncharacterized protein n=1 Tax=Aspergillus turcosus TaxID=1245748 RepID=A0A421DC42_9EURO|nr:hypothetical protein CFD26_101949 [Aspergillus turcosus]
MASSAYDQQSSPTPNRKKKEPRKRTLSEAIETSRKYTDAGLMAVGQVHCLGQRDPQKVWMMFQEHSISRWIECNNIVKALPQTTMIETTGPRSRKLSYIGTRPVNARDMGTQPVNAQDTQAQKFNGMNRRALNHYPKGVPIGTFKADHVTDPSLRRLVYAKLDKYSKPYLLLSSLGTDCGTYVHRTQSSRKSSKAGVSFYQLELFQWWIPTIWRSGYSGSSKQEESPRTGVSVLYRTYAKRRSSEKQYYVAGDRVWWYVTDEFTDDDDNEYGVAWRPGVVHMDTRSTLVHVVQGEVTGWYFDVSVEYHMGQISSASLPPG